MNPFDRRTCKKCKAELPELEQPMVACPKCGAENLPDSDVCDECGFTIGEMKNDMVVPSMPKPKAPKAPGAPGAPKPPTAPPQGRRGLEGRKAAASHARPSAHREKRATQRGCVMESTGAQIRAIRLVELGRYEGIELQPIRIACDEALVDDRISALLDEVRPPLGTDVPIIAGDKVSITCLIEFCESGEVRECAVKDVVVGSGTLLLGPEDELAARCAGDVVEVEGHFPQDHVVRGARGRLVRVRAAIDEVIRTRLDDLPDETLHAVSEFATKREFRDAICAQIEAENAVEEGRHYAQQALAALRAVSAFTETGVFEEGAAVREAVAQRQSELVLDEIARREGLSAGDQDIAEAIAELGRSSGMGNQAVMRSLAQEGQLAELRIDIARRKALRFVLERARCAAPPAEKGGDPR